MSNKPSLYFCKTGVLASGETYHQDLHPYSKDIRIQECKQHYPSEKFDAAAGGGRKKYKRHKSRKRKSRKSRKHRRKSKRHSRR